VTHIHKCEEFESISNVLTGNRFHVTLSIANSTTLGINAFHKFYSIKARASFSLYDSS